MFTYSTADKVPARLNIGLMLFFSIFFLNVVRVHFSINLLAMVQPIVSYNGTIIKSIDVSANRVSWPYIFFKYILADCSQYGPRYAWNAYDQSLLLGAYFWGYTITSIPSGILVDKFGYAKAKIGYVSAVCTVLVALSPVLAESFAVTLVLRFFIGFISVTLKASDFGLTEL